jgi:plasmid stabilization system protein ParE
MTPFSFHPEALGDLDEIWEYIAGDNLDAADRVIDEIEETIQILSGHPEMGHVRHDLTSRPIRFHPVRDLLIAYAPEEKPILVLAVLHGHRNPRIIAALLRARE